MDIDMNAMKAEIGGAFAVAWLVIGIGMEWDLTATVLMGIEFEWHSPGLMCFP